MNTAITPFEEIKNQLTSPEMKSRIKASLPDSIRVDRFINTALVAVQVNPDLMIADRRSLFLSLAKAAQDGLMCDNREATLTIFNTKKKDANGNEQWIKAAQYMPMVAGLLKKVKQSGEVVSIGANVVHENDNFDFWVDNDGEHIEHRPNYGADRNSAFKLVYAFAKLKDGSFKACVLTAQEVDKFKNASRSKDKSGNVYGPWKDWYEEMAMKSALRRLFKYLPSSSEVESIIRYEEEEPVYQQTQEPIPVTKEEPVDIASKMKGQIITVPNLEEEKVFTNE